MKKNHVPCHGAVRGRVGDLPQLACFPYASGQSTIISHQPNPGIKPKSGLHELRMAKNEQL